MVRNRNNHSIWVGSSSRVNWREEAQLPMRVVRRWSNTSSNNNRSSCITNHMEVEVTPHTTQLRGVRSRRYPRSTLGQRRCCSRSNRRAVLRVGQISNSLGRTTLTYSNVLTRRVGSRGSRGLGLSRRLGLRMKMVKYRVFLITNNVGNDVPEDVFSSD